MQFRLNDLVVNRYEIDRNIHDGSMSEVYVVRDNRLSDRESVLKVLQL